MSNIETEDAKVRALEEVEGNRRLSTIMQLTFGLAAQGEKDTVFPPSMCEDVEDMLEYCWKVIDLQMNHIQEMHSVLDVLELALALKKPTE